MTVIRGPTAVLIVADPDGVWHAVESIYDRDESGELFSTAKSLVLDVDTFEEAVFAYEDIHTARDDGRQIAWVRYDPRGKTARGVFR